MNMFKIGLAVAGLVLFLVGIKTGNPGLAKASLAIIIGAFLVPMMVNHFGKPEVKSNWRVRFAVAKFIGGKYGPILGWFLLDRGVQAGSATKRFLVKHTPGVVSSLWKGVKLLGGIAFRFVNWLLTDLVPWLWKQLPDWAKMMIGGVALVAIAMSFSKALGNWATVIGFAGIVMFAIPFWNWMKPAESAEAKKAKADKKKAELEEKARELQAQRDLLLAEKAIRRAEVDLELAKTGLQKDEKANEFLENLRELAKSGLSKENLDNAFRQKFPQPKKEKQKGSGK